MEDFVHLHVHTQYSILDGQSKIPHPVDKAIKDGMKGMAVTDHGVMFGIKELTDYCGKINKDRKKEGLEPFKPIIGCEMYVARRTKADREKDKGDMSGYHLIVLAKNYNGYKNLIKLVSNSWVDGYYMRPRTDRADRRSIMKTSSSVRHVLQARCHPRFCMVTWKEPARLASGTQPLWR